MSRSSRYLLVVLEHAPTAAVASDKSVLYSPRIIGAHGLITGPGAVWRLAWLTSGRSSAWRDLQFYNRQPNSGLSQRPVLPGCLSRAVVLPVGAPTGVAGQSQMRAPNVDVVEF